MTETDICPSCGVSHLPASSDDQSLPSTPATKRTSNGSLENSPDGDALSNKRQKTTEQIAAKRVIEMNNVQLLLFGSVIETVPLLNFKRLVPGEVRRLCHVTAENDNAHWKSYTYDACGLISPGVVEQFARWIIHGDLRFLATTVSNNNEMYNALEICTFIKESEYLDEMIDTWLWWLRDECLPGSLNVDRLRPGGYRSLDGTVFELICALVLWHDGETIIVQRQLDLHYGHLVCKRVPELSTLYFTKKEPKDPLELSDKEFCQQYHAHNDSNSPCYKDMRASEDT